MTDVKSKVFILFKQDIEHGLNHIQVAGVYSSFDGADAERYRLDTVNKLFPYYYVESHDLILEEK